MKYNINDILFFAIGDILKPCTITAIYPKTKRYTVTYSPLWNNGKETKTMVSESELFKSELDWVNYEIEIRTQKIIQLQNEIELLKNKYILS